VVVVVVVRRQQQTQLAVESMVHAALVTPTVGESVREKSTPRMMAMIRMHQRMHHHHHYHRVMDAHSSFCWEVRITTRL
jgi:hypothetical protein